MKKIYQVSLLLLFVLVASSGFAQSDRFWSANNNIRSSITTDKAVARVAFPKEFKLFNLNIAPLRNELFKIVDNQSSHSTVITLPNADGELEQFEVVEASNFVPALQARYPEIRAFSGKGITDRAATLKLSISPQGIQTMVFRTEKPNEFIEAYSQDHNTYAVFRSQRNKGQVQWICSTPEQQMAENLNAKVAGSNVTGSSTGELKTMLLAQSCNAEYSNYFGAFNIGQIGLVYAAFNATLTRCNGCYEKDLALHLYLISNTFEDQIIFFDPATDPYTTLGQWNNQLQALLTAVVGDPNYDIGHMFGASGGGGNAGCIGCVCSPGIKGRGITSPADNIPQGDNFDIDYVVHEVGHQLGGNHTFSHGLEGTGQNKEVGAGITIMGYAGITSYDPAPHSIDIYHETTIAQIQANLATKTCPITTNISANNATPVVAPVNNYTIPLSTPFALTGSATDANPGDVLTYCWEQNDNATTSGANSVASPTKLTGPNWLTFPATTSPTRLMPRLSTILAGLMVTPPLPGGDAVCNIEALSSVGRTLNFRLTVRDNCPFSSTAPVKVGQTAFTDMVVTVTNTSGPFQVTSPNTNITWIGNSSTNVTWDVNNTTAAPVSCANVKITLSTDGGNTFPIVLAASTPNDGSEAITVPAINTTTARVKIESIGNIFFDISNSNFNISNPTFDFTTPAPSSVVCGTSTAAITLNTASVGGFVTPINLVASGLPGATTVSYSVNPVAPGSSTVVTLNNVNTLTPGSYPITITGTAGSEIKTVTLTYTVTATAGPAITVQPTPQTICAGLNTSFSVTSPAATGFQWQVSTAGAGGPWNNITNGGVYSNATTSTLNITGATVAMNTYQYRAVASVFCGSTNSNPVVLTVQAPPAVTSSPSNLTVCSGSGSATFNVTATGAGITYQWQVGTTGCGGTWTDVTNGGVYSGVTTPTLTIVTTTPAMNGYAYRCVVSGTCSPSATSGCAVLTVNTPITISAQPAASTICAGANTSFTVTAAGTSPSYQWQISTTGAGGPWTNVANGGIYGGATTATLALTGVTAGMTGYQYRVIVNGNAPCPGVNSNPAVLTVNTAPVITTQPVATTTLCAGGNTTYTVAASGTGVTYQWQVSTTGAGGPWLNLADGGVYSGTSTATLTLTGATAAMNTYQFRAVATGTCSPAANSNATALTVHTPISITTQPATSNICATGSTSLTVAAAGTTPTYQWQISTTGAGGPWTNISNGGVYGGATTTTLTLTAVTAAMNGYQYRAVVTGAAPCTPVNSNPAVLNVTPQPVISASVSSILAGQQATLTVNVAPAPGLSFAWYLNGVLLPGATGNAVVATVNSLGNYKVIVTSATGSCESELKEITALPSAKLFIYPSPNDGRFTITYYTEAPYPTTPKKQQSINIYDSYGRLVHRKVYDVSQAYQLHKMDMRSFGGGVYYVVLRDANGNKIKTGEVVIR